MLPNPVAELEKYRLHIAELRDEIQKENAAFEENKQQLKLKHETTEKLLTEQNLALGQF